MRKLTVPGPLDSEAGISDWLVHHGALKQQELGEYVKWMDKEMHTQISDWKNSQAQEGKFCTGSVLHGDQAHSLAFLHKPAV